MYFILLDLNQHKLGPFYASHRYEGFKRTFETLSSEWSWHHIFYEDLKDAETYELAKNADGLILSGSAFNLCTRQGENQYLIWRLAQVFKLLEEFDNPILGICFGHQLLG